MVTHIPPRERGRNGEPRGLEWLAIRPTTLPRKTPFQATLGPVPGREASWLPEELRGSSDQAIEPGSEFRQAERSLDPATALFSNERVFFRETELLTRGGVP